jgi:hypothetical protein
MSRAAEMVVAKLRSSTVAHVRMDGCFR